MTLVVFSDGFFCVRWIVVLLFVRSMAANQSEVRGKPERARRVQWRGATVDEVLTTKPNPRLMLQEHGPICPKQSSKSASVAVSGRPPTQSFVWL